MDHSFTSADGVRFKIEPYVASPFHGFKCGGKRGWGWVMSVFGTNQYWLVWVDPPTLLTHFQLLNK